MWRLVAVVVAVLLGVPASLSAMPEQHEKWRVYRCGNLVVYSAIPDHDTKKIATKIVQFRREVFHPSRPVSVPAPAETTRVFLFESEDELREYERHGYAAWYQEGVGVNYLLLRQERWEDSLPLALSMEAMTVLSRGYSRVPPWIQRGLATFYSTYRERGDKARIGEASDYTMELLRERELLPWARILEIVPNSPEIHDPNWLSIFDAQSWMVVQYLIVELGRGEAAMGAYLEALEAGADEEPAFAQTFGVARSELPARLQAVARRSGYKALEFERPEVAEPQRTGPDPVAHPVLLAELGEMIAALGSGADRELERSRRAQAVEHLQAALALDPELARAYRGLGSTNLGAGDAAAAAENLRKAVELDRSDPRARLLLAKALWDRYERRKIRFRSATHRPTPDDIVKIREHLDACLAAAPDLLEAQVLLGRTYLQDPQGPAPGILVLDGVLRAYPGRADVRGTLMFLYLKLGDIESAFATALGGRRDDGSFARNVGVVIDGALFHATEAVEDDPARAQAIVDALLRRVDRGALPDGQAEQLARLEERIAAGGG